MISGTITVEQAVVVVVVVGMMGATVEAFVLGTMEAIVGAFLLGRNGLISQVP